MERPNRTFTVYIRPVVRVISCDEKKRQESEGMFGFHDFERCPQCEKLRTGYEAWVEI